MSKHTSLPWSDEDELLVGQFSEADARLVADGDDLLETMKMCVAAMKTGMVDLNPHDEYVLRRAESLIEKHEGEWE